MHRLAALLLVPLVGVAFSCHSEAWPPAKAVDLSPLPNRIKIAHVLISFKGAGTPATRSKGEADRLAQDIYRRAKAGEKFEDLQKQSDDQGPTYVLVSTKADKRPGEYARSEMVKGFGDASFSLKVGEIGLSPYDSATSYFGWHIIKRLE